MSPSRAVPSANWLRTLARLTRAFAAVCHDAGLVAGRAPFTGRILLAGPMDALSRLRDLGSHLATFRMEPHFGWSLVAADEMNRYHRALCEVVCDTLAAWGVRPLLEGLGSIRMTIEREPGRADRLTHWTGGATVEEVTVRTPLAVVAEYDVAALSACANGIDRILAEGPVIDRIMNPQEGDDVRALEFVADHDALFVDPRDYLDAAAPPAPAAGDVPKPVDQRTVVAEQPGGETPFRSEWVQTHFPAELQSKLMNRLRTGEKVSDDEIAKLLYGTKKTAKKNEDALKKMRQRVGGKLQALAAELGVLYEITVSNRQWQLVARPAA